MLFYRLLYYSLITRQQLRGPRVGVIMSFRESGVSFNFHYATPHMYQCNIEHRATANLQIVKLANQLEYKPIQHGGRHKTRYGLSFRKFIVSIIRLVGIEHLIDIGNGWCWVCSARGQSWFIIHSFAREYISLRIAKMRCDVVGQLIFNWSCVHGNQNIIIFWSL